MMNKEPRILVIIPAYNEAASIADTIKEIRAKAPPVDILVVDDGSKDNTAEIARDLDVTVISLPFNLGIGGAVQTGFKFAAKWDYDIAIQVDGDGQHDPEFISQLIEPLVNGKADITIGSRYLNNESYKVPLMRHIGVVFFSQLTTRITGKRISDCTSGFRALNKRAIGLFSDDYPVDFPDAEALIIAHRAGLQLEELPAKFRGRENGKSSLHFWRFLWYPIKEGFSILMLLTEHQRKID
jgi:hypothetical protein